MARLNLSGDRWVDCRLPTTDEFLILLDAPEDDADKPLQAIARIRDVRDILNAACSETSWGGKPSDLPPAELVGLVPLWLNATEDDALPPASGTDSETS